MDALVIKLKSEVADTTIPKLGTLRVGLSKNLFNNSSFLQFKLYGNTTTSISLLKGSGLINTKKGIDGAAKSLLITTSAVQEITLYPMLSDDDVLVIEQPENLYNLGSVYVPLFNNVSEDSRFVSKLEGLMYAKNLIGIYVSPSPLLSFNLNELNFEKCILYRIPVQFANGTNAIKGNVEDINLSQADTVYIYSLTKHKTEVSATMNKLFMPKAINLSLRGIDCIGDITQIIMAKSISDFRIGRLGKNDNTLSWGSSAKLFDAYKGKSDGIIIYQGMSTASIDNALKSLSLTDFSQAAVKTITLYGTRSSASDDAVTKLKNAGVSITINSIAS